VTEGVGYARDLWSEAPTLFNRGLLPSNWAAVKRFCKNVVLTGIGVTLLPDIQGQTRRYLRYRSNFHFGLVARGRPGCLRTRAKHLLSAANAISGADRTALGRCCGS
jgi:hypothetical protein